MAVPTSLFYPPLFEELRQINTNSFLSLFGSFVLRFFFIFPFASDISRSVFNPSGNDEVVKIVRNCTASYLWNVTKKEELFIKYHFELSRNQFRSRRRIVMSEQPAQLDLKYRSLSRSPNNQSMCNKSWIIFFFFESPHFLLVLKTFSIFLLQTKGAAAIGKKNTHIIFKTHNKFAIQSNARFSSTSIQQ